MDIKQFAKNEKELKSLIQTIRTYCQDMNILLGMKLCIEKCAMLIIKSGKRQIIEATELPNHERIRTLEGEKKLQVLGNIGSGHHPTSKDERRNKKI